MTLVFVLSRINQLKWFAPLIDEALLNDQKVEVWLDQRDISKTTKWFEFPSEDKLPQWKSDKTPVLRSFKSLEEWMEMGSVQKDSFIFSHLIPPHPKAQNQKWVHIVTSFFDSLILLRPEQINQFDLIFFNTPYWLKQGFVYYEMALGVDTANHECQEIRKKAIFLGTPQYDHFSYCKRDEFRSKHGIAKDAKVITVYAFETSATFWCQRIFHEPHLLKRLFYVLTLPFSLPYVFSKLGKKRIIPLFLKSLISRFEYLFEALRVPSELDIYKMIREYCDQNGYVFVLKFRRKNPVKDYQKGFADVLFSEDTDYYPYTSAQLIHATDLLVTFYSSAAGEGAFAGVPVVNIVPTKRKFFMKDHYQLLYKDRPEQRAKAEEELYYREDYGVFNYPGVTTSVPIHRFKKYLWNYKIGVNLVDQAQRERYILEYIKPDLQQASASLLLKKLREAHG